MQGGIGRLTIPLPPPPPPGPPAPPLPPADARYEFWLGKTPQNQWCATLYLRQTLGNRPFWQPIHRILTPGKDWSFQTITRPGGGTGLPWISQWEVAGPNGEKWVFSLDAFFGRMDLPETTTPTPESLEAFARLESSWQAIATQLANTPPVPAGPALPPGPKSFLRVREVLVDSDGDGILDVDELSAPNPTNPLDNDSDDDGSYDGDTPAAQDPAAVDEDGDGIPDAEDAVPYDKDILWPRLNLQYAWAPLTDDWLPINVNNQGQALCVRKDTGLTAGQVRWKAARFRDGIVSTEQVVFHETVPSSNPATAIRYELRPLGLSENGTALFGAGQIGFPHRRWNFQLNALETAPPAGPPQSAAIMNAVWLPQATALKRVLPPDQTSEAVTMAGRLNRTQLGSQAPENVLELTRSHAGLMDGAGRLYSGVRDTQNWPFSAASNAVPGSVNSLPASYQSRTALGSGLIWPVPDGPSISVTLSSSPKLAFWHPTAALGGQSFPMRSYDAVSRAGRVVWRDRIVSWPYAATSFDEDSTAVSHTFGTVANGQNANDPPVVTAIAGTPLLPIPTEDLQARNYHAIADMPDFPDVTQDPLTGEVLPRTDGPLVISRAYETWVRRKSNPANTSPHAPQIWKRLNLRAAKNQPLIDGVDWYNPNYTIRSEDLVTPGWTKTFCANGLGQVLTNRNSVWQNGKNSSLADLCQPTESLVGVAQTARLQHIWHQEINDEGLIPAEAWKFSGTNPNIPVFSAGGFCVPYEFEFPETLEIGAEMWASLALPEHFLSSRSAQLTWWKKTPQAPDYTVAVSSAIPVVSDAAGRFAFPVKTATGPTAPFSAPGDLPNAQPGELWQARLAIPRYADGQGPAGAAPWFTCYSPPVKILTGPPHLIEIQTPIPSGANAWVADNQTETPITISVKDKKGNFVADGTEVSMDLYGTASTRPVHGSEAPVEEGQEPDLHRPVFLTDDGHVTLTFRTFLTTSATAVIRSGTAEKELTIEYRGVQGTLTSQHTTLNTNGSGGTTTATLALTTPVKNGTPVVWTVSRYAPGGVPHSTSLQGFDDARRTIQGSIVNNQATIPINATGAATGLCVVTATVAEKLFVHTIAFVGNVSFSANLDREVLVADKAYSAAAGRDYQNSSTPYEGSGSMINLSTGALGTIQGVAGRVYQVRFADPNGSSGLRLGATGWSQQLSPDQFLEVTADASGIGRFYLSSTGQLSAGRVECVRLEVRDSFSDEASVLQVGAVFETIGTCLFDALAGFTGLGDTSGSYTGIIASIVGGVLSVNDAGALIKNSARAAGVTDGNVDKLETGLAALGFTATLATAAGGAGLAPKIFIQTIKAIKSVAPRLARILWKAFHDALETGKEFAYPILMKHCALWVVDPTEGFRMIKSLGKSCANPDTLARIENLGKILGHDRAMLIVAKAEIPGQKDVVGDVINLIQGLDDEAKLFLAGADNLDEASDITVGLTKILTTIPTTGVAKAIDSAQLQRVLTKKNLFRHPIPGKTSNYKQIDLLKDLAEVAKHADADGVARLIKALKSNSARASGNRYALSVTADLIKNGGATEVKFIGKFIGKWGTKGSAELDLVCREAGQWVVYEIKSTYKAIGSRKRFLGWVDKVERGWLTLGLGPLPKIKITSPLEHSQTLTEIPAWLKQLDEPSGSVIKYAKAISFK